MFLVGVFKKSSYIKPTISKPLLIHFNGLVLYPNPVFWILNPIQLFGYGLDTSLDFHILKHSSENNLSQGRSKANFWLTSAEAIFDRHRLMLFFYKYQPKVFPADIGS